MRSALATVAILAGLSGLPATAQSPFRTQDPAPAAAPAPDLAPSRSPSLNTALPPDPATAPGPAAAPANSPGSPPAADPPPQPAAPPPPPPGPPLAATEDPFRYLEDAADPRTVAFLQEQHARARAALDAMPLRGELLRRIRELSAGTVRVTAIALAGPRVFYLRQSAQDAEPVLCTRDNLAAAEKVLLDPAKLGREASIEWIAPSPDGRHVAYGLTSGGDTHIRVMAVAGAKDLPLEIDHARFNEDFEWHPDGRSFYYARVTGPRDSAVRLYRHQLGRPAERDEVVFAPGVGGALDVPAMARPFLKVPIESKWAYAAVRDGTRPEMALYVAEQRDLAKAAPRWHRVASVADAVTAFEAWRDDLYVLTYRDAPRGKVLLVKATSPAVAQGRVIVPQQDVVIRTLSLARDALYLRMMNAGVDRLEKVPLGFLGPRSPVYVKTPFDNAIPQVVTDPRRPGALLRLQGWIEPPQVVEVEPRYGELKRTPLQPASAADFSAIDEVRLYAPTADGEKIPVTLLYRKSTTLNRDNPTLLMAYGSYGVPLAPLFDPRRLAWLERGGIIAIAHVRGGGENGAAWHAAGRGERKATTVADFIAVAEFLVGYGFTNPKRLATQGFGAGAIPVAVSTARRPDLFAAMVARAPIVDLVRHGAGAHGAADAAEFGSGATPAGLEALARISAYHQVRDHLAYPAVLLTAGVDDPRADAWQAAKLAARLQAANSGNRPVLLKVLGAAASGPTLSRGEREEELADTYAFILEAFR